MQSPSQEADSLYESLRASRVSGIVPETELRKLLPAISAAKRTETPFPGPLPPSRLHSVMAPAEIDHLISRGFQIPPPQQTRSLGESGPGEVEKEQLEADYVKSQHLGGSHHHGFAPSSRLGSVLSSGLSSRLKRARDAKSLKPSSDPRKLSPPKKKTSSPPHELPGASKGKAALGPSQGHTVTFSALPPGKAPQGRKGAKQEDDDDDDDDGGQFNSVIENRVVGKKLLPWKGAEAKDMFQATPLERLFQDGKRDQKKKQQSKEDPEETEDSDNLNDVSDMDTWELKAQVGYFPGALEQSQDLWPVSESFPKLKLNRNQPGLDSPQVTFSPKAAQEQEPPLDQSWSHPLNVDDLSPPDPFASSTGEGEYSSSSNPFQHHTPNTRLRLTKVWSEKEETLETEQKKGSHSSAESLSSSSKFKTPMVKKKSTPPSSDPEGMISYPSYPMDIDDLDSLKINNPLEGYARWKREAEMAGQSWRGFKGFGKPGTELERFNNMEWDKSTNTWRNTEPQSDIEFSPPENPPAEAKDPEKGNDSNTTDDSFQQATPSQPHLHHHHQSSPPTSQPLTFSPPENEAARAPRQPTLAESDTESISQDELDIATEIVQGASSKLRQLLEEAQESLAKPGSKLDFSGKNLDSLRGLPSLAPRVQFLNLDNNLLSEISNLPSSLVELSLVKNKITSVVDPPFLPNLTSLNLSKNPLENLRDLNQFRYLKTLRLEKCNISRMNEIRRAESLVSLHMASNNLDSLDFCADLKHLTFLDVSRNRIKSVEVLQTLPSIRELRIDYNSVKELRLTNPITSLRTLQAKGNKMALLDARSFPLLRTCVIDDNPKCFVVNLSENLPWSQLKAKGLKTSNGLAERSGDGHGNFILTGMSRLKEVDLSETRILDTRLLLVRSLECLILRSCELRDLPADFGASLPDLGYLDIRDNFISDLSPLEGLQKLKGLCLTRNEVWDLEHLPLPKSILYLDLRYNKVNEGFYAPDDDKYGSEILTGGVPEWHEADADFEATLDDHTSEQRRKYREAVQSMLSQNLLSLDGIKTVRGARINREGASSAAGDMSPPSAASTATSKAENRPQIIQLTPYDAPFPRPIPLPPLGRIGAKRPHPLALGNNIYTCKSLKRLQIDDADLVKAFSDRKGPSRTLFLGKDCHEAERLSHEKKIWVTDKLHCLNKEGEHPERFVALLVEVKLGDSYRHRGSLERTEEFVKEKNLGFQSVLFHVNKDGEEAKIWHVFNRKRCLPVAVCEFELIKVNCFGIVQIKKKK